MSSLAAARRYAIASATLTLPAVHLAQRVEDLRYRHTYALHRARLAPRHEKATWLVQAADVRMLLTLLKP